MLGIFSKLLDANERELNRLRGIVESINAFEPKIRKLDDKKIREHADKLRDRYSKGESLDELLVEAFALVREASARHNNKERHFDVQQVAAIALHLGKIAEQRTGEGKTLSASPAAFLNSLTGKGVHIITVNDYLARRDCGWMGPIYHALGTKASCIIHEQAFVYDPKFSNSEATDSRLKHLRPVSRKEAYQADITYGTNNEFGFDYLRDNMVLSLEQKVQTSPNGKQGLHHFAIVDEVDSILIDEARTPLIISAPSQEPTEKYMQASKLVGNLSSSTDYVVDEKLRTAHLTEHGNIKVEKIMGVENLYEKDFETLHHLEQALKARTLFQKDKDYVVKDGEVIIVDEFTGRLMPGRRYSEGLHQAIEAKEGVTIQQESKTLATISFQNYFRMYQKLSGMTGTASTEAEEFHKIYKLDVLAIPTHMPMVREDQPDAIYKTQKAKYSAVAELVSEINQKGQPVLVGTTSIEKNEFLSELLKRKGISHALLNAKNHEKEAEIIAKAGEKGVVTVATNMAGRGVDIKLGKGVDKLDGLYVIGTERHESRRIDNQLRGRSGRQGDPGTSKFFVSLEDDLMRIFGGDAVAKVMNFLKMPEDVPIEHGLVSKAIESAQKKVEGHNFDIRKHTVEYDDVMNQQRKVIYGLRDQILETAVQIQGKQAESEQFNLKEEIIGKIDIEIRNIVEVNSLEGIDLKKVVEEFSTIIPFDEESKKSLVKTLDSLESTDQTADYLIKLAGDLYEERERKIGEDLSRQMEVFVYLSTIDTFWMEHLDTMDDLRSAIHLRAYAQRDPLIEYKKEAFALFERLIVNIDSEVVHRIYRVAVRQDHPVEAQPVIDLAKAVEVHDEALDEKVLLEDVGQLMPSVPEVRAEPEVRTQTNGETKVTIERGGQVVAQETYGSQGQLTKPHGKIGRNDPCWCGSGKKYKKCHYPN